MRTLMAVHAHPDGEGIQTGGVLRFCAQQGIRTVLVTCTNGEMGDSPDGLKPESEGHDTAATAKLRLRELCAAVQPLHVAELELLGYRDSGMMGWPQNTEPGCFFTAILTTSRPTVRRCPPRARRESPRSCTRSPSLAP